MPSTDENAKTKISTVISHVVQSPSGGHRLLGERGAGGVAHLAGEYTVGPATRMMNAVAEQMTMGVDEDTERPDQPLLHRVVDVAVVTAALDAAARRPRWRTGRASRR